VNKKTEAVQVDEQKCTACGICINACPGHVPHLHPAKKTILICDLCDGDPQCAKVCQEGKWDALQVVSKSGWETAYRVYSRKPEEITKDLVSNLYGETGGDYI
jgi:Fe-S-cluster-containing hydrogenase component 2